MASVERDSARWNVEDLEASVDASTFCIVLPERFAAGNAMVLRMFIQHPKGACVEVEISIDLPKNHSLHASDLSGIIRKSCDNQFKYALKSGRPTTILSDLYDADGTLVGELLATFRHVHRSHSRWANAVEFGGMLRLNSLDIHLPAERDAKGSLADSEYMSHVPREITVVVGGDDAAVRAGWVNILKALEGALSLANLAAAKRRSRS